MLDEKHHTIDQTGPAAVVSHGLRVRPLAEDSDTAATGSGASPPRWSTRRLLTVPGLSHGRSGRR
jgi:hypothetical protein